MIKRVVFFFLLFSTLLIAKQYDTRVITIEAKLFPKIALLAQHIKQSQSEELSITILAKEIDFDTAKEFKSKIESNYTGMIGNKKVVVKISRFILQTIGYPDAVILLSHEADELQEIALWANRNKIVSFAYDPYYLKYGILSSIYIGKSTKPYLNRKVIQKYNFIFDSYLLQLSKFSFN